jgi:RHS repeat-associated protein
MNKKAKHWAGITAGIFSLAGYASAASLGSEKYTYDHSGNITEKSIDREGSRMVYDPANRLIGRQVAGQSKKITAYDAAGRPVAVRNEEGQSIRSMGYGYGGKVIEIKNQDSKAYFYYNAEGQLVGKQANDNVSTYTWDGNVLSAEGADAFTNEAHVSGGVPVLASGTEAVVSDHLGNTLASGAKQFAGTAYGEGLEQGRFTGKVFVKELDSFTFHHRLYSPETLRWNTSDPIGFPDSENNVAYMSDPTGGVDALGTAVTELSNTVATPSPSTTGPLSYKIQSGTHQITFSHSGANNANNVKGFVAKITHSSQADGAPPHSAVEAQVTIIPNDPSKVIFYASHPATYLSAGTGASMGVTAKMTGNGTNTITADVSGACAVIPAGVSVLGVTNNPQAGQASLLPSGSTAGAAFMFGSATWIWSEN